MTAAGLHGLGRRLPGLVRADRVLLVLVGAHLAVKVVVFLQIAHGPLVGDESAYVNGGKALSNSASGTIGASERGSFDCGWSLGLGASGPLAGAVPGFTNCAEPTPANPVVDATNARASQ